MRVNRNPEYQDCFASCLSTSMLAMQQLCRKIFRELTGKHLTIPILHLYTRQFKPVAALPRERRNYGTGLFESSFANERNGFRRIIAVRKCETFHPLTDDFLKVGPALLDLCALRS